MYAQLPRGADLNEFPGNGRPRGGRFSRHSRGIGSHDSYAIGRGAASAAKDARSTADHNLAFGAASGVGLVCAAGPTSFDADFGSRDACGTADALGSVGPWLTLGPGGTARTGHPLRSFRSAGALRSLGSGGSHFATLALGALGARGTLGTVHSWGPFRSLGAVVALDAALANWPLRSYRTLGSLRSRRTLGVSRRTLGACFAPRACRTGGALFTLRTCFTLGALGAAGGADGTGLTLGTRFTSRALGTRVSPLTSFASRSLGAGRTPVAGWALDSRVALGA